MNTHALGLRALGALALAAAMDAPAHAYLGSFTPNDGYHIQSGQIAGDVTYYNAGNYGVNAGGGPGPTGIPVDSGLWKLVGPTGVGAYFSSAAARNAATAGGPRIQIPSPTRPPPRTWSAITVPVAATATIWPSAT